MIKLYYNNELLEAINYIKNIAFKYDAIIFGENTYNTLLINHKKSNINKILSNNIDIYFKSKKSYELFIYDIYIFKKFVLDTVLKSNNFIHKLTYTHFQSTMKLNFKIGETFTSDGIDINIFINYIYPYNINDNLEPPFNSVNFSSLFFIETKEGIRLSNNYTFDIKMNHLKYSIQYMRDISTKRDYDIIEDFLKYFLNNQIIWKINNFPIKIIYQNKEKECNICNNLIKNERAIILNNSIYHCPCIENYLENQIFNIKIKKTQKKFICPMGKFIIL
jgi:hypothetical protein